MNKVYLYGTKERQNLRIDRFLSNQYYARETKKKIKVADQQISNI